MTVLTENWLLVLIALVAAIAIGWYIFHATRRTRVTGARHDVLDEGAAPAERNQALIDAPVAAKRDPAPVADNAPVAALAPSGSELGRLKGVGPKLVGLLAELGVTRLEQVAAWDDADIDRIDARLDRFAGRIRRDSWVEQARLLTTGNEQGFSAKFGNMA